MIGLLDYDWCVSKSTTRLVPNIEIMKLAVYYQTEERRFCRLLSLDEEDLTPYEKIYFFSETARPKIPQHFLQNKNIIFGYMIPRPHIYKESLLKKYQDGIKSKIITHVLDDSYYRMKAGDSVLPIPPIMTNKRLFIYDRNIFIPEREKIFETIKERNPSTIIMIHPIICRTLGDYFSIRSNKKIARDNEIYLNLEVPINEIGIMLKKYKRQFLADVSQNSYVYITIGGDKISELGYLQDFVYKMNLLYSFWSANIPIKIKYIAPNFGYNNPLNNLESLIEKWACGDTKDNKTLNDRMNSHIKKEIKVLIHEEKEKLLAYSHISHELFEQTYNTLRQGGFWKV